MSNVSVKGRLPEPKTVLGVLDQQGQQAMRQAVKALAEETHEQTPRSDRGGQHLADQFSTRVTKTKTGWQGRGTFAGRPHRNTTAAKVARYVTRGTGIYREGPGPKRKIRAKHKTHRMNLGTNVRRWTVKGQRPNPFLRRARERADERARRALRQGALDAARILREKGIR